MLALAIHPTMLTGGIDLSVVSVANFSAIVAALTMRSMPPQFILVAMFIGVLIGCLAGAMNGLLVASGLPAILATLGTMQLFAGLAVVLPAGQAADQKPGSQRDPVGGLLLGQVGQVRGHELGQFWAGIAGEPQRVVAQQHLAEPRPVRRGAAEHFGR